MTLPGSTAGPFRSSITPPRDIEAQSARVGRRFASRTGREAGKETVPEAQAGRFDVVWAK